MTAAMFSTSIAAGCTAWPNRSSIPASVCVEKTVRRRSPVLSSPTTNPYPTSGVLISPWIDATSLSRTAVDGTAGDGGAASGAAATGACGAARACAVSCGAAAGCCAWTIIAADIVINAKTGTSKRLIVSTTRLSRRPSLFKASEDLVRQGSLHGALSARRSDSRSNVRSRDSASERSCETRDSPTPITCPISASVRSSSK